MNNAPCFTKTHEKKKDNLFTSDSVLDGSNI